METQPIRHTQGSAELTGVTHSAYSISRGITMEEGKDDLEIKPQLKVKKATQPKSPKPTAEEILRAQLQRKLTQEEHEILARKGIRSDTVTSKGPIEQKAEDVLKTSAIVDNNARLRRAEELLNSLKPKKPVKLIGDDGEPTDMGKAVLAAHGKLGTVYSLTQEQIKDRVKILKEAGFTDEQRRVIIEAGIAARNYEAEYAAAQAAGPEAAKKYARDLATSVNVQSGRNDDLVFEIIIDEENSLDYLVNRIISPPLDSETGDWSLGLYGQSNLDQIIDLLRTQRETYTSDDPDKQAKVRARRNIQYNNVVELEEAIRLLHTVNKSIINSDLKVLQMNAGSMTDERLTRLSRTKGVGVVSRLLEGEYGALLARERWVNGKNYAALVGKVKNPETGLLEENQDQSAFTSFKELVDRAKARHDANPDDPSLTKEMKELALLEPWQVDWAFKVGKSINNLWLRSAEWISQGQVPKGDKGYVSFPQESMARILNWPQWMLQRFEISKSRGGVKWLENVLKAHQAIREEEGYGHMRLTHIGGRKVENFEMPDMVGVRGWWATWREKQLLMSTMPIQFIPRGSIEGAIISREGIAVNPGEITDLGTLLDIGALSLEETDGVPIVPLLINSPGYSGELGKASEEMQIDYWKSIFLDQAGNVRADLKMGLGASLFFLKPHGEWEDKEHGHLNKVLDKAKEQIRAKIWQKAAEENPLGLVSYLHGLQYEGEKNAVSIVPGPSAPQAEKNAWRGFERKLFQLNEMKMQRIRAFDRDLSSNDPNIRNQAIDMIKNISLRGIITEEAPRADGVHLDQAEIDWLSNIKSEGQRAAPHLANIRFEYNPFLNDVPFEKLDYSVIGAEGFRRMVNDTLSFGEANVALIGLMDNPTKFKKPEEINEVIAPFVKGVGDILGTDVGQRKGWLWLGETYAFFERGGNAGGPIRKRFRQLPFVNAALGAIHRPNSLAQKFAGMEASNWDAQQLLKASEEALHAGVISEEEHKKWLKRFGGRGGSFFIQLMRAIFAGILVGGIETGKQGVKTEEIK